MSETLRLALVGAGRIGYGVHAPLVREHPYAELVAVVDPNQENVQQLVSDLKLPQTTIQTQELELLLEKNRDDIDAVIIASPTDAHMSHVLQSAQVGLHVFVEKPLASDILEAQKIVDELANLETNIQIGFMRRHSEIYRIGKEVLDAGTVGEPYEITFNLHDVSPPAQGFNSPGILYDMGIHGADVLRWYSGGEISQVVSAFGVNISAYATEDETANEDYDQAGFHVMTENGILGTVQVSRNHAAGFIDGVYVLGNEGRIEVAPFDSSTQSAVLRVYRKNNEITREERFDLKGYNKDAHPFINRHLGSSFKDQLDSFVQACLNGDTSAFSPNQKDGLQAQQTIKEAYDCMLSSGNKNQPGPIGPLR